MNFFIKENKNKSAKEINNKYNTATNNYKFMPFFNKLDIPFFKK